MAKSHFRETEKAHQDEIFKKKGREPSNYGADVNDIDKDQSWISSKISDGRRLTTHHDHKTGKITHKWEGEIVKEAVEIEEGKISATLLAKAKKKFREKGGINAALEKQDKEDKKKEPVHAKESLFDVVALADDEVPASHYIGEIESRINTVVNERKAEMLKTLFNFKGKVT